MLELVSSQQFESVTFRLVSYKDLGTYFPIDLGLSEEESDELKTLFAESDFPLDPDAIITGVFKPKLNLAPRRTRFSDGYIQVYYSALEIDTAVSEVRYWLEKELHIGANSTTANYRILEALFDGHVKDLRTVIEQIPFLTGDDYEACNLIAAEVIDDNSLDALLVPSARRIGGTCIPIFRRSALKAASWRGVIEVVVSH